MVSWAFIELEEVGSTQEVARQHAARGAPEGTAIVAKAQTSGTGRMGRPWISPNGGLYMSFILRPRNIPNPETITLITAAAVVEGIKGATGLSSNIRWPNDITVRGKKLGGIIAEAATHGAAIDWVVVGVGVDCNAPPSEMGHLQTETTSVAQELGKNVKINEVMHAILQSFSALYERWKLGEDLRAEWAGKIATTGKEILIKLKARENPVPCMAEEIDAEGNLVVSFEGELVTIGVEDLEWLRERG
jgi:BirA family biotin operon repressor/biotin-[acetyl-CoA-carboxylase] ligase